MNTLSAKFFILLSLANFVVSQNAFSEEVPTHIDLAPLTKTISELREISFQAEIQTHLSAEIMKGFGSAYNDIQFKQIIEGWIDSDKFLYKQIYEGVPSELNDPYHIAFDGKLFQVYKPKGNYLYFTSNDSTNASEMAGLGLLLDPYEFLLSKNEMLNIEAATLSPRQFKNLLSTFEDSLKSFIFEDSNKENMFFRTNPIKSQAGSYAYKVTVAKETMLPIAWQKIAENESVIEDYKVLAWSNASPNGMSFPISAEKTLYSKSGTQLRHEVIKIFNLKFGNEIVEKPSFTFDFRMVSRMHDVDRNLFINPRSGQVLDGDVLNN
jgi:hypothetical protein